MRDLKIISGGQTGVDRAALDAAIDCGTTCGGSVPAGRKAEDGPIADRYPMEELESKSYAVRTLKNVKDADATLLIFRGEISGGTSLTWKKCLNERKPVHLIDSDVFDANSAALSVLDFIHRHDVHVLNVAGPRASQQDDIESFAYDVVKTVLTSLGYDVGSSQTE